MIITYCNRHQIGWSAVAQFPQPDSHDTINEYDCTGYGATPESAITNLMSHLKAHHNVFVRYLYKPSSEVDYRPFTFYHNVYCMWYCQIDICDHTGAYHSLSFHGSTPEAAETRALSEASLRDHFLAPGLRRHASELFTV